MRGKERASKKCRRGIVSVILLLALFIGFETFAIFRILLKLKLGAAMSAVREAGYPITCDELDAWYSIPDGVENASDIYLDAFAHFKEWDETKREGLPLVGLVDLPTRTESMNDETRTLIAQYVTDNNETLSLLHDAAKIEHCRYPIDFNDDFDTMWSHVYEMRQACFLLNLESFLYVENGDTETGSRSILSGFGMALSLTKEPSYISQIVRMALTFRNISTLEHLINRVELTNKQINEFSQYLYKVERVADLSRAFVGFRCMILNEFRTALSVDPAYVHYLLPKSTALFYPAIGFYDMNANRFLDIMNDYMEIVRLPDHQRLKASDAIEHELGSLYNFCSLGSGVTIVLSRVITIETRTIAHLRAARTGLAVQRYRLAAGMLPDTLAELVSVYIDAVPTDPFDGNELRYKKREAGFVIYSIGEDLSDDGGTEKPKYEERKSRPNWDVTFIVER